MAPRNPFKAEARTIRYLNADGTEDNLVRIYGGSRSLAIDFSELDALIRSLERLREERHETLVASLVIS